MTNESKAQPCFNKWDIAKYCSRFQLYLFTKKRIRISLLVCVIYFMNVIIRTQIMIDRELQPESVFGKAVTVAVFNFPSKKLDPGMLLYHHSKYEYYINIHTICINKFPQSNNCISLKKIWTIVGTYGHNVQRPVHYNIFGAETIFWSCFHLLHFRFICNRNCYHYDVNCGVCWHLWIAMESIHVIW